MEKGFFKIEIERTMETKTGAGYITNVTGRNINKQHVMQSLGEAIVNVLREEDDNTMRAVLLERFMSPITDAIYEWDLE